jgi:hypothetical protein
MVFLDQLFYATVFTGFEAVREFLAGFRCEPPFCPATALGDMHMRWFVVLVAEEVEAVAIFEQGFGRHRFSKILSMEVNRVSPTR